MSNVVEHKLVNVSVDKIKFDDDNPNEMSDEQMAALSATLDKFGNLAPVILSEPSKKGEYTVIDGEHRVRVYIDKGMNKIPAHIINVSRIDKKILRQVMNKLRGQHDPAKDEEEFLKINNANRLDLLSKLLGEPKEQFLLNQSESAIDPNPLGHHEDTFLTGNLKQIFLMFNNEEYESLMPRLESIKQQMGVTDNTEMFMRLVKFYEDNQSTEDGD